MDQVSRLVLGMLLLLLFAGINILWLDLIFGVVVSILLVIMLLQITRKFNEHLPKTSKEFYQWLRHY